MACARSAIVNDRPTALSKALGFLVRDYEPAYFWWELLEAWKKRPLTLTPTLPNRSNNPSARVFVVKAELNNQLL